MFISEAHCYHYVLLFLVAYKNVRFFLLLSIAAKKDPAAGETFWELYTVIRPFLP